MQWAMQETGAVCQPARASENFLEGLSIR